METVTRNGVEYHYDVVTLLDLIKKLTDNLKAYMRCAHPQFTPAQTEKLVETAIRMWEVAHVEYGIPYANKVRELVLPLTDVEWYETCRELAVMAREMAHFYDRPDLVASLTTMFWNYVSLRGRPCIPWAVYSSANDQ